MNSTMVGYSFYSVNSVFIPCISFCTLSEMGGRVSQFKLLRWLWPFLLNCFVELDSVMVILSLASYDPNIAKFYPIWGAVCRVPHHEVYAAA